jgi:hypothetical protein
MRTRKTMTNLKWFAESAWRHTKSRRQRFPLPAEKSPRKKMQIKTKRMIKKKRKTNRNRKKKRLKRRKRKRKSKRKR